jgi:hypothetical protein
MFIAGFRLKTFVQQVLCTAYEIFDFGTYHPVREIRKRALSETVDYIQSSMPSAIGVYTPRNVLDIALNSALPHGHVLEFGVFKGGTIRYIAAKDPNRSVHGFDSFEGLPEAWTGNTLGKGTFALGDNLPKVPRNVALHRGWFNETLPKWLTSNPGEIAFVHIDCDVYSSTKTIFDLIAPRLVAGSIIVFDEYFGYPNWKNHEFKAFQGFVQENAVKYEYLAYARVQVAIKLL